DALAPSTMVELSRELPERLFRTTTLGHVLDRADVFQPTIPVADPVRDAVHVFDRAVRHQQSILEVDVAAIGLSDHLPDKIEILRVHALKHQPDRDRSGTVIAEDAERLVGPEMAVVGNAPAEAARQTELLGFGQIGFGFPPLLVRPFPPP